MNATHDGGVFNVHVTYDVHATYDVEYGVGRIGAMTRPLCLDVYEPVGADGGRPALVLAFGGAFHRGSKRDDSVPGGPSINTSIASYCEKLAGRGYVACSIDYRLIPEDPHPGDTPVVADPASIPRSRVDVVRTIMGLPPATPEMLWRGIEAASDDMASAFRFIRDHAAAWRIDARRIAVGGFSAGARTALNAAFGENIEAAAIVSLSGFMARADRARLLACRRNHPPVFLLCGDRDLDYVRAEHMQMVDDFQTAGVACVSGRVLEADHFYPAAATVRLSSGALGSVEDAMVDFLAAHLPKRSPG